jgi:hypothetical protein
MVRAPCTCFKSLDFEILKHEWSRGPVHVLSRTHTFNMKDVSHLNLDFESENYR